MSTSSAGPQRVALGERTQAHAQVRLARDVLDDLQARLLLRRARGAARVARVPRGRPPKSRSARRIAVATSHRAREGEHRVVRRVVPLVPAPQRRPRRSERTCASLAGDREAQRVVAVDERARQVVRIDLAALVVEVLEDLLEHDAALDVDVAGTPAARAPRRTARSPRRATRAAGTARRSRGRPASTRRASRRALEREVHRVGARDAARAAVDHVLEEVADAVVLARLEARADARPERDVRTVQRRQRRHDDAQPVGERRDLVRASAQSSDAGISIRPRLRRCRSFHRRPWLPGCRRRRP